MNSSIESFNRDGYVRITEGLLSAEDFTELLDAVDTLEMDGDIDSNSPDLQNLNDAVYRHDAFMKLAKLPKLVEVIESIFGRKVELQHSKMINKYPSQGEKSVIHWHQDFPFFPHTNYDLLAVALHFDDESDASGPLQFASGTHIPPLFSHCEPETGEFLYRISDPDFSPDNYKIEKVLCKAGDITLHHGNVIHASSPSKSATRRILYLQYRAIDAIQLAGAVWKCSGLSVHKEEPIRRSVRFISGEEVELRSGARLFDITGKLAPDNATTKSISTD